MLTYLELDHGERLVVGRTLDTAGEVTGSWATNRARRNVCVCVCVSWQHLALDHGEGLGLEEEVEHFRVAFRVLQREFFIRNLLVRIQFIIVMIGWTGLAPWEFEFHFPVSLTSTFLNRVLQPTQPRVG